MTLPLLFNQGQLVTDSNVIQHALKTAFIQNDADQWISPDAANDGLRRDLLRGGIGQYDGSGHSVLVGSSYSIPAGASVVFECYVRFSSLAADQMLMYSEAASAAGGLGFKYDTATDRFEIVKAAIGPRAGSTLSCTVDTWCKVKFEYNMTSGAYAFTVDDRAAGSGTDSSVPTFDLSAVDLGQANATQRFSGDFGWCKLTVNGTPIFSYDFSYSGTGATVKNLLVGGGLGTYDGTLSGDAGTFWGTALEVDTETSRNRAGYNLGLVSSDTTYIDTGFTATADTIVRVGVRLDDLHTGLTRHIAGCGTSPYFLFGKSTAEKWVVYNGTSGKSGSDIDTDYHDMVFDSDGLTIDGVLDVDGPRIEPFPVVSGNILLYKWASAGASTLLTATYWQIEQGGSLVFDGVPVASGSYRYSSTPAPSNCLWDKVSETYFENDGTGDFGLAYIPRLDTDANKALPYDEQLDVLGNTLEYYGPAPLDLTLKSGTVTTNGTDNELIVPTGESLLETGDLTIEIKTLTGTLDEDWLVNCSGTGESLETNVLYAIGTTAAGAITYSHEYGAGSNVGLTTTDGVLSSDTYHEITVVRDASAKTVTITVDGVELTPLSYTDSAEKAGSGNEQRLIIANGDTISRFYPGTIIYTRVLTTSDEVEYNFGETSGTTAYDTSGNGNHGTWTGDTSGLHTTSSYQRPNNNIDGYTLSGSVYIPAVNATTDAAGNTLGVSGDDTYLNGSETTAAQLPNASELDALAEKLFVTNPWFDGSDDPNDIAQSSITENYEGQYVWTTQQTGGVIRNWIVYATAVPPRERGLLGNGTLFQYAFSEDYR